MSTRQLRRTAGALYDVAIVGGRVAGAILAALLGDAGFRVIVVDRDAPGSDTLSTHYTTGAGLVGVLRTLGLLDEVLALGAPPLVCEYRYYGGARDAVVIPAHSPGDVGFALSIRRRPLDALLQRRAAATPGVTIRTRTRAVALVRQADGRVVGLLVDGADGRDELRARLVVGADGRRSSVARWVAAPATEEHPGTRALIYRYVARFRGPDGRLPDGSEFSLRDDEAAYAFPSDADVTCVALSLPVAVFEGARTDLVCTFETHLARHGGLSDRVFAADALEAGRLRGAGALPNWIRRPSGPGWALVGDAGLHLDPWTGRGMDFAAVHATYLAEAIVTWMQDGRDETEAMAQYAERRDAHAVDTFHFTVEGARDLRPLTNHAAWGIPPLPAAPPSRFEANDVRGAAPGGVQAIVVPA